MKSTEWAGSVKVGRKCEIPHDAPLRVDISCWNNYAEVLAESYKWLAPDERYDLAMEGLIRAAQTFDNKRDCKFSTWLKRSIHRKACNIVLHKTRRSKDHGWFHESCRRRVNHQSPAKDDFEMDTELEELMVIINDSGVSEQELQIIYRNKAEGETLQNISRDVGVSREWTRVRMNRAIGHIEAAKLTRGRIAG